MLNVHFYFHLLVLAENVTLAAVPVMLGKYGRTYFYMMAAIVVLWVVSIVCKYVFYKLWGHPWKDINGPRSYLLAVCGCLRFYGKRRGEHLEVVEMGDLIGKRRAEINEVILGADAQMYTYLEATNYGFILRCFSGNQ